MDFPYKEIFNVFHVPFFKLPLCKQSAGMFSSHVLGQEGVYRSLGISTHSWWGGCLPLCLVLQQSGNIWQWSPMCACGHWSVPYLMSCLFNWQLGTLLRQPVCQSIWQSAKYTGIPNASIRTKNRGRPPCPVLARVSSKKCIHDSIHKLFKFRILSDLVQWLKG